MTHIRTLFYAISAWASGGCLILMTLLILAQVIARMSGVIIPSSEDFAGWLLSATLFFGLAYTFAHDGHIRVTILLGRLSPRARQGVEYLNLAIGLAITCYLAYYTVFTAYESYVYQDVTDTYLPMPLWLVQTPMALGATFLALAVLDSIVLLIAGGTPQHMKTHDIVDMED